MLLQGLGAAQKDSGTWAQGPGILDPDRLPGPGEGRLHRTKGREPGEEPGAAEPGGVPPRRLDHPIEETRILEDRIPAGPHGEEADRTPTPAGDGGAGQQSQGQVVPNAQAQTGASGRRSLESAVGQAEPGLTGKLVPIPGGTAVRSAFHLFLRSGSGKAPEDTPDQSAVAAAVEPDQLFRGPIRVPPQAQPGQVDPQAGAALGVFRREAGDVFLQPPLPEVQG